MLGISWSSGLRHQDSNEVILQVCGSIPSPAQYFFIKLIFHELLFSFLKFIKKNIYIFLIAYFQFFWKISSFQTSANKFIYQWYFKSIKVGLSNFYSGKLWIDLPSTPDATYFYSMVWCNNIKLVNKAGMDQPRQMLSRK